MDKEKNLVVKYIQSQEKKKEDLCIGPEFEHIIVDRKSYESVSYWGEKGVEYISQRLVKLGFKAHYEKDHILGLDLDDMVVSTEPGGQLEFSCTKKKTISEVERSYKRFFSFLLPILDELNYDILAVAYHPVTKIEDIKLLPKARYNVMFDYFKNHGSMSHNMMKGTAGLQLSLDFTSEEDFKKKFVVANAMTNALYSIFDNGYFFEGKPTHHNIRAMIWENTDPVRSGLAKNAFINDSYEGYAEYLLSTPAIFGYDNGELVATGEKTIGELLDKNNSEEAISHYMTMVFPDVRVKKFIEIRIMDAVPYPYNFGAFALIKGILYNKDNLEALYCLFKDLKQEEIKAVRQRMYVEGNKTMFLERSLKQWCLAFIDMAQYGLSNEEAGYLVPLKEFIMKEGSFYEKSEKIYEETGNVKKAVEFCKIKLEEVCTQEK